MIPLLKPSEIIANVLGNQPLLLSCRDKPCEEVARIADHGCCIIKDIALARTVQEIFTTKNRFRVYTKPDMIGVELGAAMKKCVAIARRYMMA